jgi:hypothetical protein
MRKVLGNSLQHRSRVERKSCPLLWRRLEQLISVPARVECEQVRGLDRAAGGFCDERDGLDLLCEVEHFGDYADVPLDLGIILVAVFQNEGCAFLAFLPTRMSVSSQSRMTFEQNVYGELVFFRALRSAAALYSSFAADTVILLDVAFVAWFCGFGVDGRLRRRPASALGGRRLSEPKARSRVGLWG